MSRGVLFLLIGTLLSLPHTGWAQTAITGGAVPCTNGRAAGYPCQNVDLLSYLPIPDLGGTSTTQVNDIWGWTDPGTGKEYALVGRDDGIAFVDISNPESPVYVGELPSHTLTSRLPLQRDVKVYADHAFVVSEVAGHGMQVFDLTQLREVATPPVTFSETAHYDRFGQAHNIAINKETGFAYAVGITGPQDLPASYSNQGLGRCGPGLHMINIQEPESPAFAGCFTANTPYLIAPGYTHDAQCVVYNGPDADYQGREICIGSNERAVSIADVTDKANPVPLAQATYPNPGYVHQGWLTEDQRYFLLGDELDERNGLVDRTRTLIWDFSDLDEPELLEQYFANTSSIDHNLYTRGPLALETNYTSGLRILNVNNIQNPREVGYFDTHPADNALTFEGTWSNYPYFESGIVIVSSIGEGLFVLRPSEAARVVELPSNFSLSSASPNPFNVQTTLALQLPDAQHVRVAVYNVLGRRVAQLHDGMLPAGTRRFTFEAAGRASGTYIVRATSSASGVETELVTLVK